VDNPKSKEKTITDLKAENEKLLEKILDLQDALANEKMRIVRLEEKIARIEACASLGRRGLPWDR
jgi:predicted RNase H-like nuclease (RuvC/YqgF family)